MSRRFLFALCSVFMFALASCSDDPVQPPVVKPLLTGPSSVGFGDVASGTCKDTTIRYDNTTGQKVTISSATIAGAGFEWTGVAFPVEVAAGASVDLKVRFCPVSMDTARATLEIKGTGGEAVKITLTGHSNQVTLKVGDRFNYSTFETDESGTKIDGTEGTQTDVITAVNTTYRGKSNVYIVSEEGVQSYYSKESNGDISTYIDPLSVEMLGSSIGGWKQLPYGSKLQNVELLRTDTSFIMDFQGTPVTVNAEITQIASYAGQTSMDVEGKTYPVENVTFTTTVTLTGPLGLPIGNITNTVKGGYIRSLGYQGRFESLVNSTITLFEVPTGGYVKTLTSVETD